MNHPALEALKSDDFLVRLGVTSNARAIHRALERSAEVDLVRLAMYQGQIDEDSLRDFTARLLQTFQPGVLFPYDLSLAALAVVLESRPTRLAEELLSELARVDRPELPLAIRVGQECLRVQSRFAGNISRIFNLVPATLMPSNWEEAPAFVETDCEEHHEDVVYGT
jgi:hypothetical protein